MADLPVSERCNCDPGEPPVYGHSSDCPAYMHQVTVLSQAHAELGLSLLEALVAEVRQQDRRYGRFSADVAGVRLAAAALEDEAEEVKRAWKSERKVDDWTDTRTEAMQAAAVAVRLIRDAANA